MILKIVCILCSLALLMIFLYRLICISGGKILAKILEHMIVIALKEEGKEPTTENVEVYMDKILEEIEEESKDKVKPNLWIDEDIDE